MKARHYISVITLLFGASFLQAQNTFQNAEITQDHDLQGTARYVAMGGAFSALGAEISAMGDNPAATALMRKSEVAITAGALWGADETMTHMYSRTHATFDQGGLVGSFRIDGRYIKNFNIGFNYHKKINFNNLNGGEIYCVGSQLNQLAGLLNAYGADIPDADYEHGYHNLYTDYRDAGLIDMQGSRENPTWRRSGQLTPTWGQSMYRMTSGGLHAYDINFSVNVKDRYYLGLNIGVEHMNYRNESSYAERIGTDDNPLDYYIEDLHTIKGTGVNFKLGAIIRPIEDNPLRLGVAIETPTWFLLTSRYDYWLYSKFIVDEADAKRYGQPMHTFVAKPGVYTATAWNFYDMDYSLRTPWRFRLAIGSTVSNWFAWGADFEYSIFKYEGQGYPANDERRSIFNTIEDVDMNANTRSHLSGQYRVKFGLEAKPTRHLALRAGYNYISSIYKNEEWDPGCADESTVNSIGTSWVTTSPTHLITMGLGTRIKWFGIDLAYKCRLQHGYYFGTLDAYPANVEMNQRRHTVVCTLSARF